MRVAKSGGGWRAIRYSVKLALRVGPVRFLKAMRAKNACKTCAYGMGGQLGGMRNEIGHFPEVCKKSMQAMAADMRGRIQPGFFEAFSLSQLNQFSPRELELMGRLTQPVMAGPNDTHYRVVTWEEAMAHASQAMRATDPDRSFFYASGRSSNEAGFLLQLLARVYGTNHVNNCSFYCHQASGVGLKESIGSGTATIEVDDIEKCDLVFLFGANPASNHPRMMAALERLRRRGGNVIVVNPAREAGLVRFKVPSNLRSMISASEISSLYLQPTIGGDIALIMGMAKVLIERNAVDQNFIEASTEGFEEVRGLVESTDWPDIESASGLARADIESAADLLIRSERTVLAWTMGITHHLHGVQNVQWIVNLGLMRGMVGKPGAGLLPIRGHSNVQGMGTVGVTPAMSKAAVEQFGKLGLTPPTKPGHDTMAAMEAAGSGEVDFALCLGGNLFGANPDANFAQSAMSKIGTVVYLSTALNTGHVRGRGETTVILPVRVRDEELQPTTQESMFSYVRLSDGGPSRFEGPRSEVEILTELGDGVVPGRMDWNNLKDHDEIRELIAKLVPKLGDIQDMGRSKREFHIPGRVLHTPEFPTPTKRARFHAHPFPRREVLQGDQLRLMTVRSEGQFNTVVYDEDDPYRGQERRDVILINPKDLHRLGLSHNQPVEVSNEAGSMRVLAREFDIAPGCALMYYPEANVLVPRAVDPKSKTPSYKSAIVTVAASDQLVRRSAVAIKGESDSRNRMKAC